MSSDNILVIGRWPKKKGGFEYRVADVGYSQYSSTYGSGTRQITPGDAACVVEDFCNCEVFFDLSAARKEARRIRKEYFAFEQALEYGTTNQEFEETFSQLIAMALDIMPAAALFRAATRRR